MKFSAVFLLAFAAAVVSAETNAERMARGLAPNAPARRGSPVDTAKRGQTSSTGGNQCSNGGIYCCNDVGTYGSHKNVNSVVKDLGLQSYVPIGTQCGLQCSPITGIGAGSGASCSQQTVCCQNNNFNGLINIGCSPINISL
ncbi:fungal hydrophobin-domain-containing protein [Scleroderma yunnanense]